MTGTCRICLATTRGSGTYHSRCLKTLFGSTKPPTLNIELAKLHTAALAMLGQASLSGVQKKISVNLSADRETLQVATDGGRFILKPQTDVYSALPENEQITSRLATLVEIETASAGLVALKDGSLAYIVRRFDRLPDGRKLRQEDFCQLSLLSPKEKYDSTAERCVKLVYKYASEPLVEVHKLFRQLVFAWWTGNGDLHLKNLSLFVDEEGIVRLTPAYDLVCTRLVIPDDPLALSVGGKKDNLSRKLWLKFAEHCRLPEKTAIRVLDRQAAALPAARELIERSFLPPELKSSYIELIAERTERL